MANANVLLVLLSVVFACTGAPPVKEKPPGDNANDVDDQYMQVEYSRYLREIVDTLEKDENFRTKLQNASEDDIKSGKIAHELEFVDHGVRSKLDEIKRQEVERLRRAAVEQMELNQGLYRKQIKIPKHLDHRNQETFEIDDLKRLIHQTTKDLEELDRKRRTEFKEYEMNKEMQRLEKMKAMDEERRRKAQEEFDEQQRRHKDHPKLHHPGSKQQLEEVWEKQDHLPANEFDPKLFFRMHDLNGDKHWSLDEVNALFQNELNKMYDPNASEDDMRERYEEMERMREHVFNETDTNRDGLISFEEFVNQAKNQEFEQDPGWQGLDEQTLYSKDEYEEYVRRQHEENARLAAAGINPYGGPMGHPNEIPHGYPQQGGYQPVPPQMHGQYPQQGYQQQHPQGYPQQHQQGYPQQHPQGYQQQHPQVAQMNNQQGMHDPYRQMPPQHGAVPPNVQVPNIPNNVPQRVDAKPVAPNIQQPPQQQAVPDAPSTEKRAEPEKVVEQVVQNAQNVQNVQNAQNSNAPVAQGQKQ